MPTTGPSACDPYVIQTPDKASASSLAVATLLTKSKPVNCNSNAVVLTTDNRFTVLVYGVGIGIVVRTGVADVAPRGFPRVGIGRCASFSISRINVLLLFPKGSYKELGHLVRGFPTGGCSAYGY